MKKLFVITIAFSMAILMDACLNQPLEQDKASQKADSILVIDRTENFQDYNFEAKISYPVFSGFPDLMFQEEVNSTITYFIDSVKDDLAAEAKLYTDESESNYPFNLDIGYAIKCNCEGIISLLLEVYQYSGGAHGFTDYVAVNVDAHASKLINLSDLFKENSNYVQIIQQYIGDSIGEVPESFLSNMLDFNKDDIQNSYYLTPASIVVFLPLYDLAPFSSGIPEFSIPLSQFKHIFTENYQLRLLISTK